MSTSGPSVFFTGATGYIGGIVLTSIISSATPPSLITPLIRDSKKAEAFTSLDLAKEKGVTIKPLIGSLEELDKIRDAASEHDVVVSVANADDLKAINAILEGFRIRKEKTGHRGVLIHTSGTGVLIDDAKGAYPNDKIYTDLNPTPATKSHPALLSLADLSAKAPHREVDLAIIDADAKGWVRSYIILPSTIWGEGTGEVYEKGLSNSVSDQIPTLIKAALDRGRAGVIGEGKNIWPHVRNTDLAALYALVYAQATAKSPTIGHGKSGYYLGISGEYTLWGLTNVIGRTLVDLKFASPKAGEDAGDLARPTSFTKEEIDKYYSGSDYMGTNSRGVADRSKSIGWKPKYTEEEELYKHVESEVARVEAKFGRDWGDNVNAKVY